MKKPDSGKSRSRMSEWPTAARRRGRVRQIGIARAALYTRKKNGEMGVSKAQKLLAARRRESAFAAYRVRSDRGQSKELRSVSTKSATTQMSVFNFI